MLPDSIRVKISSEGAEMIALTPVVNQEMTAAELIEVMLTVVGRDEARMVELLQRGSLVSGGSRFRWQPFRAERADVARMLDTFPSPDPSRVFSAERCVQATLVGSIRVAISKDAGERRRLFRRRSYWDALMDAAEGSTYVTYSYRDKADLFRKPTGAETQTALQQAANLLTFGTVVRQIESMSISTVEYLVKR